MHSHSTHFQATALKGVFGYLDAFAVPLLNGRQGRGASRWGQHSGQNKQTTLHIRALIRRHRGLRKKKERKEL